MSLPDGTGQASKPHPDAMENVHAPAFYGELDLGKTASPLGVVA